MHGGERESLREELGVAPSYEGTELDFFGDGKPRVVFGINQTTSTFTYDWYIVAADDEINKIREALNGVGSVYDHWGGAG
jgi:hypothetical protein